MYDHDYETKETYRRHRKVIVSLLITVLILLVSVTGLLVYSFTSNVMTNLEVESFTPEEVAVTPEVTEKVNQFNNQIKNVLLIGIDSDQNKNEPQRSDSMTIVTLDDMHKSIKMTSLMRDSWVEIEGHGKDKLNHAYAYGGAKLLLKTINQNFDMNLEDYVLVDFNNLIHIIDAIGGVDLFVTWQEAMYMNFNIENINKLNNSNIEKVEVKTQNIRLNGAQALSFARIRYLDSDYKRSERQRILLLKVYERFKEVPLLELPGVIMKLSEYAKTSLNEGEILDIASKALSNDMGLHGIHFPTFQSSEESTKGTWHILFDKEATISEMHNWIFNDIDPYRKMTLQEIEKEKASKTPSTTTPGTTSTTPSKGVTKP